MMSEKSFEITLPDHKSSEDGNKLWRPIETKEKASEKETSIDKAISKKQFNDQSVKSPTVDTAESSSTGNSGNDANLEDKSPKDMQIAQPECNSATGESSFKSSELTDKPGNDRASERENKDKVRKFLQEEKKVNFIGVPPIMNSKQTRRASTILIDRSVFLSNQLTQSAIRRQLIIFSVSLCFVVYVLLRLIRS